MSELVQKVIDRFRGVQPVDPEKQRVERIEYLETAAVGFALAGIRIEGRGGTLYEAINNALLEIMDELLELQDGVESGLEVVTVT